MPDWNDVIDSVLRAHFRPAAFYLEQSLSLHPYLSSDIRGGKGVVGWVGGGGGRQTRSTSNWHQSCAEKNDRGNKRERDTHTESEIETDRERQR